MSDIFHVVCWAAARDLNEAMTRYCDRSMADPTPMRAPCVPLRYLQLLGLSSEELGHVRDWVYDYMVHDVADNQFKRRANEFGKKHLLAFLKIKHYFRLVDAYRNEDRIILLPAEMVLSQLNVLRRRLYQAPYEATHRELGMARICGGCNGWATLVKPSPIWIECRNDTKLMAERVARMEKQQRQQVGRPLRLEEYLQEPHELCAAENWTGLDGHDYCRHGKYTKDTLTEQRQRARHQDAEGDEEEDDDDESDDDDDTPTPPPHGEEGEENSDSDAEYGADRLFLELIEPSIGDVTSATNMPARLSTMRFGRATAARLAGRFKAEPAAPPAGVTILPDGRRIVSAKKKNSAVRAATIRMLNQTMAPVLKPTPRFNCRTDPLLVIDMIGVWYSRAAGDMYGLCCYCGDLTTVRFFFHHGCVSWVVRHFGAPMVNGTFFFHHGWVVACAPS